MPSYTRVKKTKSIVRQFQKVATTNHYEVFFSGFASLQSLRGYISSKAPLVSNYFIGRDFFNSKLKYKNPRVSKDVIGFELFVNWNLPIVLCEGVLML